MDQECQQCDDTYDKINFDIQKRNSETPLYHLREQWRLYKELRNLNRQTDDIGKRLKRIKENPIQIIRKT